MMTTEGGPWAFAPVNTRMLFLGLDNFSRSNQGERGIVFEHDQDGSMVLNLIRNQLVTPTTPTPQLCPWA